MVVFRHHVRDLGEVRSPQLTQANLLMVERAITRVLRPHRMNVVKFANACEHLHWHLVPRFDGELFPQKNAWEMPALRFDEIHHEQDGAARSLPDGETLRELLVRELQQERESPLSGFFSCAFFLRPVERRQWMEFACAPLERSVAAARACPEKWETLLMRRNYADFSWDHVGGRAECGEFPVAALRREVSEEIGWSDLETLEVTRQWQAGLVRGFVFAARPAGDALYSDRTPPFNSEIAEVKFYSLAELRHDAFPKRVRSRVEALLAGSSDFLVR
jgi:8-oxo-dGTP pyrophosphatase MutT (NUDIX family)